MVVVLDTTFLMAYFGEGTTKAKKIFSLIFSKPNAKFGHVEILDYVFDEFLTLATSRLGKEQAIILEKLLMQLKEENKLEIIFMEDDLFKQTIECFNKDKKRMASFTDEAVIEHFKRRKKELGKMPCHIIAFDRHFNRPDLMQHLNLSGYL